MQTPSENEKKKGAGNWSWPPMRMVDIKHFHSSGQMQVYWNERKRVNKKKFQLPQDLFGTPNWSLIH